MIATSSECATTSSEATDFPCLASEVILLAAKHWHLLPKVRGTAFQPIDARRATWDLRQLSEWANELPSCRWALVTGVESGVIVLEIDALCDLTAIQALSEFDNTETLCARAGSKSLAFLHYPEGMRARLRGKVVLAPGLAVRTDGDQVVLPSYASGSWPDLSTPIIDAPEWLRICAFEPNEKEALPPRLPPRMEVVGGNRWRGARRGTDE